jgi:hypothetical protein
MMVAVAKVSRAEDSAHARRIADEVISVLSRLASPPGIPQPGLPRPGVTPAGVVQAELP